MEAVDDFITYKDKFMKSTVWEQDCRSWYKGNTIGNKVTALWAGSTLHYKECLEEVRYEDYNVKCWGNRFDYFGNGLSRIETFPDADLAYYVRPSDDGPNIGSKFVYEKASLELQGAGGAVVAEKPKETRGSQFQVPLFALQDLPLMIVYLCYNLILTGMQGRRTKNEHICR